MRSHPASSAATGTQPPSSSQPQPSGIMAKMLREKFAEADSLFVGHISRLLPLAASGCRVPAAIQTVPAYSTSGLPRRGSSTRPPSKPLTSAVAPGSPAACRARIASIACTIATELRSAARSL